MKLSIDFYCNQRYYDGDYRTPVGSALLSPLGYAEGAFGKMHVWFGDSPDGRDSTKDYYMVFDASDSEAEAALKDCSSVRFGSRVLYEVPNCLLAEDSPEPTSYEELSELSGMREYCAVEWSRWTEDSPEVAEKLKELNGDNISEELRWYLAKVPKREVSRISVFGGISRSGIVVRTVNFLGLLHDQLDEIAKEAIPMFPRLRFTDDLLVTSDRKWLDAADRRVREILSF